MKRKDIINEKENQVNMKSEKGVCDRKGCPSHRVERAAAPSCRDRRIRPRGRTGTSRDFPAAHHTHSQHLLEYSHSNTETNKTTHSIL